MCAYEVAGCVCRTRRDPNAVPPSAHRSTERGRADHAYRAAFGGQLANEMGTVAHSPVRVRRVRQAVQG